MTDMFRVPKLAAALYASQQDDTPVMEFSSMDIGEHPAASLGRFTPLPTATISSSIKTAYM